MYAGHGDAGGRGKPFLNQREALLAEQDWLEVFLQSKPNATAVVLARTKEIDALLNANN